MNYHGCKFSGLYRISGFLKVPGVIFPNHVHPVRRLGGGGTPFSTNFAKIDNVNIVSVVWKCLAEAED